MGACTRKPGNVCMSESSTCIASTSSSLTLRAHYVHHSSSIPERRIFCLLFLLFVFLRFVPMFYKRFDATTHKFLVSLCQGTARTSLLECLVVPLTPFLGAAMLRLSATLSLGL